MLRIATKSLARAFRYQAPYMDARTVGMFIYAVLDNGKKHRLLRSVRWVSLISGVAAVIAIIIITVIVSAITARFDGAISTALFVWVVSIEESVWAIG